MSKLTDREYLVMAYQAATKSPDPSTQNGAVIPYTDVGAEYMGRPAERFITGWTDFPPGVANTPERLVRPLKYQYVEHAERNCILNAAREYVPLKGATMYVPWFACSDCARAIICSGIRRLVGHKKMADDTPERWKESITHAMNMLREAGVEMELLEGDLPEAPLIRFNEKLWQT